MKTILILISFVAITTSGNSQGRYGRIVRTAKKLSDAVDIISIANDAYEYLAPETSYPIRKEDYSKVYNKNWSNIISKNYKPILPSVQFEDNARKLALDYRNWANSTSELASKYGKTSKYDLDRTTNGVPNNSYFRKSYTQGKKEFHKTHPLKKYGTNAAPNLGPWKVDQEYLETCRSYFFEESENKKFIEYIQMKTHFESKEFKLNSIPTSKASNFYEKGIMASDLMNNKPANSINPIITGTYKKTWGIQKNNDKINYSYLDQKLEENINRELVNFNREINSILIKSKSLNINLE